MKLTALPAQCRTRLLPIMLLTGAALLQSCAAPSPDRVKMPSWFEGYEDSEKKSQEKSASSDKVTEAQAEQRATPEAEQPPTAPASQPRVSPRQQPPTATQQQQAQQAEKAYQQALGRMRTGQLDQALSAFKQLGNQYPELTGPIANQAVILRRKGELKQARALLKEAIASKPASTYLLTELGIVQRRLGNFKAAKKAYEAAIRTQPDYAVAHFNLAVLADLYLHDPGLAKTAFEAYQKLLPEPDKRVAGWLVEISRRLDKKDAQL